MISRKICMKGIILIMNWLQNIIENKNPTSMPNLYREKWGVTSLINSTVNYRIKVESHISKLKSFS